MDAPSNATPGIGHNEPNAFEAHQDRVNGLKDAANAWLDIEALESDEQAENLNVLMAQARTELKAVETSRMAEKRPHLDANIAIDEQFNPLKTVLETINGKLKPLVSAWLLKKEREAEAARKVAEAAALEKIRVADEAAKKAAEAAQDGGDVVGAAVAAQVAEEAATEATAQVDAVSAPVKIQGKYDARSASLRTSHTAEIDDFDAALNHFRDHPKVKDLIEQLAGEAARSPEKRKTPIPGVRFVSKRG